MALPHLIILLELVAKEDKPDDRIDIDNDGCQDHSDQDSLAKIFIRKKIRRSGDEEKYKKRKGLDEEYVEIVR
tara:strand:+ start:2027 stop:2245 length:219 start_codon:yes stop_codon:yes gene_type:complete